MQDIPLLWINCDSSVKRAAHMISQCSKFGYNATRIPAITGDKITAKPRYGLNAYACLLSHLWCQQQLLMNSCVEWVAIAEDDVVFLGKIHPEIIKTAPSDATLLQLTTLTGSHYDTCNRRPLWTRSTNGFYGTQLYLVRVPSIAGVFQKAGIIDVWNYTKQMLPQVPDGLEVADSYTYCMHTAYLCSYPFAYSDISLGSELHPEHLEMHQEGWSAVLSYHRHVKNPYLMEM